MIISDKKQKLNLRYILNSDYKGFWLRLKRLGYKPGYMWLEYRFDKLFDREITISVFTFRKDNLSIRFKIAKARTQFITFKNKKLQFKSKRFASFSLMEKPFLEHFKEKRPLTCLRTFERLTEREILKKQRKKRIGKSSSNGK